MHMFDYRHAALQRVPSEAHVLIDMTAISCRRAKQPPSRRLDP